MRKYRSCVKNKENTFGNVFGKSRAASKVKNQQKVYLFCSKSENYGPF